MKKIPDSHILKWVLIPFLKTWKALHHKAWNKIFLILLVLSLLFWISFYTPYIFLEEEKKTNNGSIIIFDKNGAPLTIKGKEWGYSKVYTGSLDAPLIEEILQVEDARFFEHNGLDIRAKVASIIANIEAWAIVRGWSTITEQYIKNTYFPSERRSIFWKMREAYLGVFLELLMSKDEILRKYLDTLYLWNGIYGIQAGSEVFFWKSDIKKLTEDERIELLYRIHSPSDDKNESYKQTLERKLGRKYTQPNHEEKWYYINLYPIFTSRIENELKKYCKNEYNSLENFILSSSWIISSDFSDEICNSRHQVLHTWIDKDLMEVADTILSGTIRGMREKNIQNGSILIIDTKNKKVKAYLGNIKNWWSVDMITRRRSVGSILKPFLYLLALKNWASVNSFILDDIKIYPTGYDNKWFIPQNYIPKSYGPVRLREALGNSLNASAVRITETIWLWKVYEYLRQMGIDFNHDAGYYGYGLILWTPELTLENIVWSYEKLTHFEDPNIYIIANTLSDERNRTKTFGISSVLNTSHAIPVKTGTSTDFRDNWAIWYTNNIIIGVWVGNNDGSPMIEVSWISWAWSIWRRLTEYMIETRTLEPIKKKYPNWIYERIICQDSSCFQKEVILDNTWTIQETRPKDGIFYRKDFFWWLDPDEQYRWNIQD